MARERTIDQGELYEDIRLGNQLVFQYIMDFLPPESRSQYPDLHANIRVKYKDIILNRSDILESTDRYDFLVAYAIAFAKIDLLKQDGFDVEETVITETAGWLIKQWYKKTDTGLNLFNRIKWTFTKPPKIEKYEEMIRNNVALLRKPIGESEMHTE